MKNIILSTLFALITTLGFSQLTYVPDDAFELYLEGSSFNNDNFVSTSVIQSIQSLAINPAVVPSGVINDFTGIEDFSSLHTMGIQNMNMTNVDLSALTIISSGGVFDFQLSIQDNNLVENLILPQGGGIKLLISDCISLSNIVFHSNNIIEGQSIIGSCPSLTNFDVSMVSFVKLQAAIWLANNSSLQCVNLKNGYCSNWSSVGITNNPLVTCVEVDNPSYSNLASGITWNWDGSASDPNNVYSTNCGCVTSIDEEIIDEISISPNPTSYKINVKSSLALIGEEYIIYDQLGKAVKAGVITAEETEIDLSNLSEGVYLFKAGAEMQETFKIIKQ
jgi:hypothetical protein